MAEAPNYHIKLWPEPPGPPTYLCLLCPLADQTEAAIQAHITTEHAVAAVPTPMAADTTLIPTLVQARSTYMAGAPTYWTETTAENQKVYHCCYCQEQGSEHHSADEALFLQHMEQRHDGRMVEDVEASAKKPEDAPAHPHGGPPGQTGEHPQGGPPGQTGEHPEGGTPEEEPHPEHPITLPEVEHHEERA